MSSIANIESESKEVTITLKDTLSLNDYDDQTLTKSYLITVINLSPNCLTTMGSRRIGGTDDEWKWTAIPRTCQNCTTSYDQCFTEKRWSPILSVDCTAGPFELFVGYLIGENQVRGTIQDITPDCNVAGGVIGFY